MKIVPTSRTLKPAFAIRRATPSPASTTYNVPLTIRRLDDCARWALGGGPAVVPSVMRRVPAFDGAGLVCAMLSCASAKRPMLIRVVNNSDDSFCIYPSMRAGRTQKALLLLPTVKQQYITLEAGERGDARDRYNSMVLCPPCRRKVLDPHFAYVFIQARPDESL